MKKYLFCLLFFSGCMVASAKTLPEPAIDQNHFVPVHEYHISKCNIAFKESEQALQITMHIFIDDLEEALRQGGVDQLYIATEKEHKETDQYILLYLNKKLKFSASDRELQYTFLGKEQSEDLAAVWCYLEITNVNELSELTITNQLLIDVFDDQKNITSVQGPNNKTAFFMFQKGQSTDSVQFP